jgi:hypothetical protein
VQKRHRPEPFFVTPARSFAFRERLMLESPPPYDDADGLTRVRVYAAGSVSD